MNRMVPPEERSVAAVAPVRVADLGGWTDTWFAGHGLVCNIAVQPGVEVVVSTRPGAGVEIVATDFGHRYRLESDRGRHPLLEAAVDEVGVPAGCEVEITVHSTIPPGASTGTSAAVTVALVAALSAFRSGPPVTPGEVAAAAHRVEAVRLRRQTGIQDQLCSAHGGINLIRMSRYPEAEVAPVDVDAAVATDLEARLLLVLLGRSHVSSEVHDRVIAELEAGGADALARLDPLREAAAAGAAALEEGDLERYGAALVANTEAQGALHPGLVSADAHRVIDVARREGAAGWKVNGAGGDGGSMTLLAGRGRRAAASLAEAVRACDPRFTCLAVHLDGDGVQVRPA